jgi:branched-chain amino acid transport system ATP-binding protein
MADKTILTVTGLSKKFDGVTAVDDMSFDLSRGEILGLIGPNGSGKSTLINMITGFVTRTSGKVIFNGRDISRLPVHKIAGMGITRTFQIVRPFYSLTPVQNLVVPLSSLRAGKAANGKKADKRAAALKLLERTGFEKDRDYNSIVTSALSLVYVKRLELARCLALEPEIIICDEIFSGLSVSEIEAMSALIGSLRAEGITFIMIEHRFRELFRLADRVLVMNFGKKIAEGSPREILANELVRDAYLGVEVP